MRTKLLMTYMAALLVAGPVGAQTIEDELMIEAETAIADSEAAIQEAKEADKIATEERKVSDLAVSKAERELQRARREEAKAKRDIASAERKRSRAIEESEKAKIEADQGRQAVLMAKDELEDMKAKLEESERAKQDAIKEKQKVDDMVADIKRDLKNMNKKLVKAKKEELATVKALGRAETRLKDLQNKAAISYKTADKDTTVFISAVESHRKTLRKISKKLDELEIEVETDKSFYDKQRRKRLTRTLGSTVNTVNGKVAKVMTSGCNIRNFPSLSSRVLGKTNQGNKVKVKKFNRGWYSVIHDGQKAFMGAGCFQ